MNTKEKKLKLTKKVLVGIEINTIQRACAYVQRRQAEQAEKNRLSEKRKADAVSVIKVGD